MAHQDPIHSAPICALSGTFPQQISRRLSAGNVCLGVLLRPDHQYRLEPSSACAQDFDCWIRCWLAGRCRLPKPHQSAQTDCQPSGYMHISQNPSSGSHLATGVSSPNTGALPKSPGFERKPGVIAQLKGRFEQFKSSLDSGRTKFLRSTSMSTICAANIRSSNPALSPRASRQGSQGSQRIYADSAKHQVGEIKVQVEVLLKATATFEKQSAETKAHLLYALNTCISGSLDKYHSGKTLALLSECIREIVKTSAETNGNAGRTNSLSTARQTPAHSSISQRPAETGGSSRNSGTVNSMTAFLKSILEKCEARQAELAFRNEPSPQVAQAPKASQATQASELVELDELEKELADLTNVRNQPSLASASSQVDTPAANGNPQRLSDEQERDEFNKLLPDWERQFSAEITAPPRNGNANLPPTSDLPPALPPSDRDKKTQ